MSQHGRSVLKAMKRPMVIILILFFIIDLIIMPVVGPIIPDPGPNVSPENVCCDGCGSLSIPVKNIKDTVFNGRIEIKIADPNGNIISKDSISITLAPSEERVIKTPICPPCSSLRGQSGTYQITTTVIEDSGKTHDSKNTFFVVQKCPTTPQCTPGPTETYQCADNKVKRLYKNADCTEYWEIIKDCDQCNDPPCKCAVGSCIHDDGTGGDEGKKVCNSTNCQSGPFSTPYYKNGEMYQRYKDCACVDGNCECKRIDKQCTGRVYGHIYDKNTNLPIKNAIVFMSQNNYLPSAPTNDDGYFSFEGVSCPSTLTTLSCSAEGYESATKSYIFTDGKGDLFEEFMLSQSPPSNAQSEDRGTLIKIIAYFRGEILKYNIYGIPIESPSKSWVLLRSGEIICDNIGDDYKNYCRLFDDFSKPADAILDGVDLAKTKIAIESATFGFANAANELMPLLSRPEAYLAGASTAYSVFIKVGGGLKVGIVVPRPDLISKLLSTNDPNILETEKWTRVDQGSIL